MATELDPYRLQYPEQSLHQKAYHGEADAISRWLASGGDVDVRAENGHTLLHAAVHGGRFGSSSSSSRMKPM